MFTSQEQGWPHRDGCEPVFSPACSSWMADTHSGHCPLEGETLKTVYKVKNISKTSFENLVSYPRTWYLQALGPIVWRDADPVSIQGEQRDLVPPTPLGACVL